MIQLSATWLNDSNLGFGKPRSKELKLLDAEIETYRRMQNWTNLAAVVKALIAWEKASPMSERHRKPAVVKLKSDLDIYIKIIKAHPVFSNTSPAWVAVINALSLMPGVPKTEALQTALDAITPSDAEANVAALKVVIDANPTVCYIGVRNITPVSSGTGQGWIYPAETDLQSRRVRYTSAKFTLSVMVYTIAPVNSTHELGFIQQCNSKSDRASYTDGSGMEDASTTGFPVGDAPEDVSHHPWYCKGQSIHCTHPSWIHLIPPARTIELEMNDSFDNNFHQYHPKSAAVYIKRATLSEIKRVQSFSCWLAHKKPNGSYHLLRRVNYTINVDVRVNAGAITSCVSTVNPIASQTLLPNATLPLVASDSMNNKSQWKYRNPTGTAWMPVVLKATQLDTN